MYNGLTLIPIIDDEFPPCSIIVYTLLQNRKDSSNWIKWNAVVELCITKDPIYTSNYRVLHQRPYNYNLTRIAQSEHNVSPIATVEGVAN